MFQHKNTLLPSPNLKVQFHGADKILFLLNAAVAMEILDLISHVHLISIIVRLPRWMQYSTFSSCCWCVIICNGDDCLEILFILVFPHSFPFHIVFLLQLVCQSCSVVPFLLYLEEPRHLHTAQSEVHIIQGWSLQTREGFLCYCNRCKSWME